MPRDSQIPALMDRVRAASKKNPDRNWRSYPARKGNRGRRSIEDRTPTTLMALVSVEGGLVTFQIDNRGGHVERVMILGTNPEVIIDIDGNESHSASLPVEVGSATVEIRRQCRDGELLVSADLSGPQESADEYESPDPSQPFPGSEQGSF